MIHVILNVKVLTSKTSPNKPMHNVPTYFEPKDIGYKNNAFKDVNEDGIHNVSDNMSDILKIESLTKKKDDQVAPDNVEVNNMGEM